ncbi:MAG: hypothetical protein ACSHX6_16435 [Akkermansiaceae bacterium]
MNDSIDNDLREIEAQLANLSPTQMPDDMLIRMEQAMMAWETHLPVEEKIVPFNQLENSAPATATPARKNNHLQVWGAAAAIALLTSVTAVFMGGNSPETPVVAQNQHTSAVAVEDRVATNSAPELSRNITHASNEGITYAGKNEEPFKVLRIEYTEKVTTHDKDGKPVVTEKPCVEHVLIPIPVH